MTVEILSDQGDLTFRQRWSHYLAFIFVGVGLLIGLNLRESTLNVSTLYTNPQAGISAQYPQNWLLEEGGSDFIFRVSDTSTLGHNTSIQVAVRPISSETSARNIFDSLTLARAQTLAKYEVISEDPFVLPDETVTSAMTYVFVASPTNPFLQNIPVVVEGIDILIIERGQAIIVSFLSSADTFNENLPLLQQFLRSLEF
jgi:hypothetical protein